MRGSSGRRALAVVATVSEEPQQPRRPSLPAQWQAVAALNAATLIWGSQHAVIKDVVAEASPSSTNAARFVIAALAALPFLPGAPWRPAQSPVIGSGIRGVDSTAEPRASPPVPVSEDSDAAAAAAARAEQRVAATWSAGAELGAWSFLGFALQAVGLQYTTASRSAFLLYLNVKLVPLLALLLYGRPSPWRTWASAALALGGTALLSYDGSSPNIGDAWSVAAALSSACFILRLEEAASPDNGKSGGDALQPEELNAATIVTAAVLTTCWAAAELALPGGGGLERAHELTDALAHNGVALLYLALVTTAVAQWLQALGQTRVAAQDAAVIYALDPVFAAGFSYLLLGETLGPQGLAGVAVVLSAVALSRTAPAAKSGGSGSSEETTATADPAS